MTAELSEIIKKLWTKCDADLSQVQPFSKSPLVLDTDTVQALAHYCELLISWSERVDLISPLPPEQVVSRHIIDSLVAAWFIQNVATAKSPTTKLPVLDVGSGGGLPGIPIAIIHRDRNVYLCEPREKRAVFLKEAKRQLGLANIQVVNKRIEDIKPEDIQCEAIRSLARPLGISITRATGIDELFLRESSRLLAEDGLVIKMAGPKGETNSEPAMEPLEGLGEYPQSFAYSLPPDCAGRRLVCWNVSRETLR